MPRVQNGPVRTPCACSPPRKRRSTGSGALPAAPSLATTEKSGLLRGQQERGHEKSAFVTLAVIL